jgi:predicted dehydrogenase
VEHTFEDSRVKTIGIIANGATGRICSTQHLKNALVAIRDEGGVSIGDERVMPRLLLVGRNADRLGRIAGELGVESWTTDLDAALSDQAYEVFFDAAATSQRPAALRKAIAAGKHIYTEKPVAPSVHEGQELLKLIEARGLRHGCVEDKLYLPGFRKLAYLRDIGFFGQIISFKLEFGWWVFDGSNTSSQRPSWNYKSTGGGGLTLDMYPHWRYLVEGILGPVERLVSANRTAIARRIDEFSEAYDVDVDDTALNILQMASGATGMIQSSWATRVRRDDLVTFQVDGTKGSAVATLHKCFVQSLAQTPKIPGFNANMDVGADYRRAWGEVDDLEIYRNPYRMGWEAYLRHLVSGSPIIATFAAGIRDVQFAQACNLSSRERRWVDMEAVA